MMNDEAMERMGIVIPSNPADRKKVFDALREIDNAKTRIDAENSFIKDVLANVEESYEIPKKRFRKVANIYHKQNLSEVQTENEEVQALYEALTGEE